MVTILTKLERLEKQRVEIEKKRKNVQQEIAAEKRREKKKAEQAARLAEQEEALNVWRFCKSADVHISVMQNGEKTDYQLADYIRMQMAIAADRAEAAREGGPA